MLSTLEEVKRAALGLPSADRASLAEELIGSLEPGWTEEDDRWWAAEATRRLEEIQAGKAQAIPAEEVFADAWRRTENAPK